MPRRRQRPFVRGCLPRIGEAPWLRPGRHRPEDGCAGMPASKPCFRFGCHAVLLPILPPEWPDLDKLSTSREEAHVPGKILRGGAGLGQTRGDSTTAPAARRWSSSTSRRRWPAFTCKFNVRARVRLYRPFLSSFRCCCFSSLRNSACRARASRRISWWTRPSSAKLCISRTWYPADGRQAAGR